jgi:hypothetical protein
MKLKIPANNLATAPIENMVPLKKVESDMLGKNVKDAMMIKTIFAVMIDTTKDIETLNMSFEFTSLLV